MTNLRKIPSICLFEENHCSPVLLEVPIYSTELVELIRDQKIAPVKLPSWSENCTTREIVQRKIVPQQIPLDVGYGLG